jgi:hypothetical protein
VTKLEQLDNTVLDICSSRLKELITTISKQEGTKSKSPVNRHLKKELL